MCNIFQVELTVTLIFSVNQNEVDFSLMFNFLCLMVAQQFVGWVYEILFINKKKLYE